MNTKSKSTANGPGAFESVWKDMVSKVKYIKVIATEHLMKYVVENKVTIFSRTKRGKMEPKMLPQEEKCTWTLYVGSPIYLNVKGFASYVTYCDNWRGCVNVDKGCSRINFHPVDDKLQLVGGPNDTKPKDYPWWPDEALRLLAVDPTDFSTAYLLYSMMENPV